MQNKILKHLGKCIRAERTACGLTQQKLADQIGGGLRHTQNIEKGLVNPSFMVLYSIVHRLGISADLLFYPDMGEQEKEAKYLLNKIAACTKEERQIILNTVNCLADQFISRHYSELSDNVEHE